MKQFIKNTYRFLFLFLILGGLMVTGFHLNTKNQVSQTERRTLQKQPDTFLFGGENLEKYIADHLPYRDKMIELYFKSNLFNHFAISKVFVGKNRWLFKADDNPYNIEITSTYKNSFQFTEDSARKITANLLAIQNWCQKNNIRLYFIVPPDKFFIYTDYFPDYFLKTPLLNLHQQLETFIPGQITYIPLVDKLKTKAKSSTHLYYYKIDSHWSEEGAFVAFQELLKAIQTDFPDVPDIDLSQFRQFPIRQVYEPYAFSKTPQFTDGNLMPPGYLKGAADMYMHYELKENPNITIRRDIQFRSSDNLNKSAAPYNVYIICDSYASLMYSFLTSTFRHVNAYRYNEPGKKWGIRFEERKKEMLQNKTNILILSVSDLKLIELLNIN